MKIALSAAETSGDLIASSLVAALKQNHPHCEIDGLAGDKMIEAGCKSLWHTDEVNVMGLSEILKKLPSVLKLRSKITEHYISNKPDVFVGVDSPDFNFRIEHSLKKEGVKTIHFISPSVWAWRSKRIKKIKSSADLILCLFPFEVDFFTQHSQKAIFVGHPLAETLKPREEHKPNKSVLLMPGSRESEIKTLLPELLEAVKIMQARDSELTFNLSLANEHLKDFVEQSIQGLDIKMSIGDAHKRISDSDLVIVASGTAALEVALLGVPMVVIYKLSNLSYQIVKRLLNTKEISLPNKILGKKVVPELIQKDANGQNISNHAMTLLESDNSKLVKELEKIHVLLNHNSSSKSAEAIIEFINEK
ncbi:MAG: lipid-A-disaccharide synthase [Gammaproteobacteria bacterium]|jgi:lipid-A-disaccharide synthase|nr:lipid-A-disaccharide synthase [Gammaproteobacteria bacterium]